MVVSEKEGGLICPRCHHEDCTSVLDSRPTTGSVRRRRICDLCKHRFTTYEIIAEDYKRPQKHIGAIDHIERALEMLKND